MNKFLMSAVPVAMVLSGCDTKSSRAVTTSAPILAVPGEEIDFRKPGSVPKPPPEVTALTVIPAAPSPPVEEPQPSPVDQRASLTLAILRQEVDVQFLADLIRYLEFCEDRTIQCIEDHRRVNSVLAYLSALRKARAGYEVRQIEEQRKLEQMRKEKAEIEAMATQP